MTADEIKELLEQNNTVLFGQLARHFDKKVDGLRSELNDKIDQVQKTVDGIADDIDTDNTERTALISEVDRHGRWIKKAAPKLKLDYDEAA